MTGTEIDRVMEALYAAMERWYTQGGCGGLRQLTVPTRNEANRWRSSTEFIENVTRFCPNIENLDGCYQVSEDGRCENMWTVSIETWKNFVATCTKLQDFDWTYAPFADPFFKAFGEHQKPQLESLQMTPNLSWDWEKYTAESGDRAAAPGKPGYGRRAQDAGEVFKGCPSLTSVNIEMNMHQYGEEGDTHFNINVFGDLFWKSAATHCPLIESIRIDDSSSYQIEKVEPIQAFTDVALLSLARLKYLNTFESNVAVMCTGNGLFQYLCRVSKSSEISGDYCLFVLRLGGREHGDFGLPLFYPELVTLLRRLSETDETKLGAVASGQKLQLVVANPYVSKENKAWSAKYMRNEVLPLVNRIKEVHRD